MAERANKKMVAVHYLETYLQANPWDNPFRVPEAQLLDASGDVEEAISTYEAAISQEPNNASIYEAYGDLCFRHGMRDVALDNYQAACRLAPQDPNYANRLRHMQQDPPPPAAP
jgi:tetratricopeptide (TPR) repeat protein